MRARRALILGIIAVFIAMAGLSLALETEKPEWRDPEYGHRLLRLREIRKAEPNRPLVLVLGTSRTQNAVRPAAMGLGNDDPRVFNFGLSGASPLKVMLTLQRLLDEGMKPRAVIVEVLPVWLTMDGPAEEQFRERAAQLSRDDIERLVPYCDCPELLRERWLAARAVPFHSQRIPLMSHVLPQWLPWQQRIAFQWQTMDPDGFVPFLYAAPPPAFRAKATAESREHYAHAFAGMHPSAISLRAIRDLVSLCRTNGIAIAFFEPPTSPVFRSWFAPGVWDAGKAELRAFARKLDVDVIPAPTDFRDEDFADGHHLLRGAAQRYSEWLRERCCTSGITSIVP